jgi:hypothetical protein
LFVAAAYLNILPVVREMIDPLFERHGTQFTSIAFGCPYVAAARGNSPEVLRFLLEKFPTNPSRKIPHFNEVRKRCLSVAGQCGHLETVDMLLDDTLPTFATPRTPKRDYLVLDIDNDIVYRGYAGVFQGALNTTKKEVFLRLYEYAQSKTILSPKLPTGRAKARFWVKCVRAGDVEMVRFALMMYSRVPNDQFDYYPLELAAGVGNAQVLQVLLDYTAPLGRIPGLMSHAAAGGHLDVVKMLVEQGYNINEPGDRFPANGRRLWNFPHALPPPIVSAIELEHVPMFRYLRDAGARFGQEICGQAVGRAKAYGLESMLELLAQEGVDVDIFPPSHKDRRLCDKCRAL